MDPLIESTPTSGELLRLEVRLQLRDIIHANRLYRAAVTPLQYWALIAVSILFVVAFVSALLAAVIVAQYDPSSGFTSASFRTSGLWMIFFLVLGLALILELPEALTFWLRFRRHPDFYHLRTLIFSEQAILQHQSNADVHLAWPYFSGAVEGSREFILLHGRSFVLVPKRCLPNEEAADTLRNLIKRKLSGFTQKPKLVVDLPIWVPGEPRDKAA